MRPTRLMRRLAPLALLAAVFGLSGCFYWPDPYVGGPFHCNHDETQGELCAVGYICEQDYCLLPCNADTDCDESLTCNADQFCTPPGWTPDASDGGAGGGSDGGTSGFAVSSFTATPDPAGSGQTITLTIVTTEPMATCTATVNDKAASCSSSNGDTCTCTIDPKDVGAEGQVTATVTVTDVNGSEATDSVNLIVDTVAPTILDMGLVHIVRTPLGEPDTVTFDANAVTEATTTVTVQLFDDATATQSRGEQVIDHTKSQTVDLTNSTGQAGDFAPTRVWVVLQDSAGNASAAPLEITDGVDVAPPTLDMTKWRVVEKPARLFSHFMVADPGGATDATSVLARVEYHKTDGSWVAVPGVDLSATDGSIPEFAVEDPGTDRILPVRVTDKCGNVTAESFNTLWTEVVEMKGRLPYDDSSGPLSVVESSHIDDGSGVYPPPDAFLLTGREPADYVGLEDTDVLGRLRTTAAQALQTRKTQYRLAWWTPHDVAESDTAWLDGLGVVAYGGSKATQPGGTSFSEVDLAWYNDGNGWRSVHVDRKSGSVPAVFAHTVVEASKAGTLFVIGGRNAAGNPNRNVHALTFDAPARTLVAAAGLTLDATFAPIDGDAAPGPASCGCAIYFGGESSGVPSSKTWEITDTTVTEVATTGPTARIKHGMATDPATGLVYVFGGSDGTPTPFKDLWEYDHGSETWRQLDNGSGPVGREDPIVVWDRGANQLLVGGGRTGGTLHTDFWLWNGAGWDPVNSADYRGRSAAAASWHQGTNELIIFGGDSGSRVTDSLYFDGSTFRPESLGIDPRLTFTGTFLKYQLLVNDPRRGRVWMFGGTNPNTTAYLPDVYSFDGYRWQAETDLPTPKQYLQGAYDPFTGDIYLFGGETALLNGTPDLWRFDGSTYQTLTDGTARSDGFMTWDRNVGGMIVASGRTPDGTRVWDQMHLIDEAWVAGPTNPFSGCADCLVTGAGSARHLAGGFTVMTSGFDGVNPWPWRHVALSGTSGIALTNRLTATGALQDFPATWSPRDGTVVRTDGRLVDTVVSMSEVANEWDFGASTTSGHDAAHDPVTGEVFYVGAGEPGIYYLGGTRDRAALPRRAAQLARLHMPDPTYSDLTVTWVAGGAGATPGASLYAWDPKTTGTRPFPGQWAFGDGHGAGTVSTATERTLTYAAPAATSLAEGNNIYLLVLGPPSTPDTSSVLSSDYVSVAITRAVP